MLPYLRASNLGTSHLVMVNTVTIMYGLTQHGLAGTPHHPNQNMRDTCH